MLDFCLLGDHHSLQSRGVAGQYGAVHDESLREPTTGEQPRQQRCKWQCLAIHFDTGRQAQPAVLALVDVEHELVDVDRVEENYRRLTTALPLARVYYAVKANPHPAVLAAIAEAGGCFDVASPAETGAALATGADASRLLSSNPMQSRPAIRHHHAAGIDTFVVDSLDEARKVAAEAPGATLLARLATSGAGSDWSLAGKFGGPEVRAAMHGHILAQASLTGTYTLNPQLQK